MPARLFLCGTEIAAPRTGSKTRETSSPLEHARFGIAIGHNTCRFLGFHGRNAALPGLAGQHYRFPERDDPLPLEYKERELVPRQRPSAGVNS